MNYAFRVCKHYCRIERFEVERETEHRIFTKYHGQFSRENDSFRWFATFSEAVEFAKAVGEKRLKQLKGNIVRINTALHAAENGDCMDADFLRRDMPNTPIQLQ